MATLSLAQAERQLTAVADRFDEWRQTRSTRAADHYLPARGLPA